MRCFKKLSRALLWLAASFKYWLGLLLCDGVGCGGLTRPWPWNRERKRPIAAPASEYIQDTFTHPHHPNSPYPPPPLTTMHSIYRRQGWKQFHIKIYINGLESSIFLRAYFFHAFIHEWCQSWLRIHVFFYMILDPTVHFDWSGTWYMIRRKNQQFCVKNLFKKFISQMRGTLYY